MVSILCIEDETELREDVVELLRESGYETYEASNGEEGLSEIRRTSPDLVLCDITMPKMNGYQLLEEIRTNYPEYANTPFIFLSALAERQDIVAGKLLGADDYLTKPIDFLDLQATIRARLGQVERMNNFKEHEVESVREEIMQILPHELRTPLNHIIGFSEILKDESFGPIGDDRYRQFINEIHEAGIYLNSAISGILTLADITAKRFQPAIGPCKATACIEDIFHLHGTQASEAGISFVCETAPDIPMIMGNRAVITQALSALVSNAIKFTSDKGRIDVKAEKGPDQGWVKIEVQDNGIGFSQGDLDEALKPFSQLDKGLARRFEGVGLGLPLAKALSDSMGGILTVTSLEHKGTTATLLLPEWVDGCIN